MDQLLFQDWLNAQGFDFPAFLMRMPDNPSNAISFVITEGIDSRGSVDDLVVTMYVRADHPEKAVSVCSSINKALNYKTNFYLGNTQIILIKSNSIVPVPMGVDENERYVFQLSFKMLTSYTDKTDVVA